MSDDEWIYDSVVGFLNSHLWSVPVESFVDAHCLVFDACETDLEVYNTIHSEYKQLVEELLEGFTNDIHITSEQFIEGCEKGSNAESIYTKSMFEYVFAAVNFSLFRQIMVRHNAALSLQALQMIRGTSDCGTDDLMAEVMKMSEGDFKSGREDFSNTKQKEMADLEAALVKSRLDCETLLKDIEKDKVLLGNAIDSKTPDDMMLYPNIPSPMAAVSYLPAPGNAAPLITFDDEPSAPAPPTPASFPAPASSVALDSAPILAPLKGPGPAPKVSNEAAQQWMAEAVAEQGPSQVSQRPTQSLEDRQAYWLEQKQRLIKTKQAERLNTLDTKVDSSARPKSSRVARRAVIDEPEPTPQATPKGPAMSEALAARLKKEVIGAHR